MKLILALLTLLVIGVAALIIFVSTYGSIDPVGLMIACLLIFLLTILIVSMRSSSRTSNANYGLGQSKESGQSKYENIWLGGLIRLDESKKAMIAFGICAYALAISDLINRTAPNSQGRWAWLHWKIYELFGPFGMPILWLLLGTFLVLIGLTGKTSESRKNK